MFQFKALQYIQNIRYSAEMDVRMKCQIRMRSCFYVELSVLGKLFNDYGYEPDIP